MQHITKDIVPSQDTSLLKKRQSVKWQRSRTSGGRRSFSSLPRAGQRALRAGFRLSPALIQKVCCIANLPPIGSVQLRTPRAHSPHVQVDQVVTDVLARSQLAHIIRTDHHHAGVDPWRVLAAQVLPQRCNGMQYRIRCAAPGKQD